MKSRNSALTNAAITDADWQSLARWGWTDDWVQAWMKWQQDQRLSEAESRRFRPGRITTEHRGKFEVVIGEDAVRAEAKGRLRKGESLWPATGDWVVTDEKMIVGVLPRRTCLERKAAGETEDIQILAANIDWIFIATSLNLDLNPRRLERFLVAARDSKAKVCLLLTKIDLDPVEADKVRLELKERLNDVTVLETSAHTGAGVDQLKDLLNEPANASAVFLGSSGVGKSSLVNALLGRSEQTVQEARGDDDKGRHTTTGRHSYLIPSGGVIIDTPGIRELQIANADTAIEEEFSDIEELSLRCKFTNCTHTAEKGCALRAAIDHGQLDQDRLYSYTKLKSEIEAKAKRRGR